MSLRDAAEHLGVHYMTAYRYVRSGRLVARKRGGEWRVDPADLVAILNAPPTPTGRAASSARASAGSAGATTTDHPTTAARRAGYRPRLEERLVAGDEPGAWAVVEACMASGADPDDVLLDLVSPCMVEIGERWRRGELSIAEEHRATAVAQRLVGRLGPRFARRGRKRGGVVLGSAPGDRHALPSAILADLLRGEGFEVVDLGADVPPECFVDSAWAQDRLVAVGVCVTVDTALEGVADICTAVQRARIGAPILVGGSAVPDAERALGLGADLHATSGPDALRIIGALPVPAE